MKFQTFLQQAAACQSDEDADNLLKAFIEAFTQCEKSRGLVLANDQAFIEGKATPYIKFELNWVISGYYIVMISPEIRDGKAAVVVEPNFMKNGLGMASQNYSVIDGVEEAVIEASESQTADELLDLAIEAAIAQYREILEKVGLTGELAAQTARARFFGTSAASTAPVTLDLNVLDSDGIVVDGTTASLTTSQLSDIVDHSAQLILLKREGKEAKGVLAELEEALSTAGVITAIS